MQRRHRLALVIVVMVLILALVIGLTADWPGILEYDPRGKLTG